MRFFVVSEEIMHISGNISYILFYPLNSIVIYFKSILKQVLTTYFLPFFVSCQYLRRVDYRKYLASICEGWRIVNT